MHAITSPSKMTAILLLSAALPIATVRGVDPATARAKATDAPLAKPAIPMGIGGEAEFVEPQPGQLPGQVVGGWYLGVYGNYTPTGLVLTNVYHRTPAARFGLEVGDRIVAVNGRQVGGVNGLPIDVSLQRYATFGGQVRLLVQDRRSKQLINIDVQLVRGRVHA